MCIPIMSDSRHVQYAPLLHVSRGRSHVGRTFHGAVQERFSEWMALPRGLEDVLLAATRNQSKALLCSLLYEIRRALGIRLHRITWLHDLYVAMLQVCSAAACAAPPTKLCPAGKLPYSMQRIQPHQTRCAAATLLSASANASRIERLEALAELVFSWRYAGAVSGAPAGRRAADGVPATATCPSLAGPSAHLRGMCGTAQHAALSGVSFACL